MRIARTRSTLVAAVSLAAAVALTAPLAHAEPATDAPAATSTQGPATPAAPEPDTAELDTADLGIPSAENAPEVNPLILESLGAFAPALIGSIATRDDKGEVNHKLLDDARAMADNPALPADVKATWISLIDFLGEPGATEAARIGAIDDAVAAATAKTPAADKREAVEIPRGPGAPRIQQFLYPTIGLGCMPGGGNSVGMALVTAGPQKAPAPGPKRGQAGYVYTALGTGPALKNTAQSLWVEWINLDNGRRGKTRLQPNPKINATEGPGTFTAIANTGRGRIVSTIYGNVTTKSKGKRTTCGIAPTIGTAII